MNRKVYSKELTASQTEICQKLYEKEGAGAVYEYCNKIKLKYHFCKPCETKTPTLSAFHSNGNFIDICAICGTYKALGQNELKTNFK